MIEPRYCCEIDESAGLAESAPPAAGECGKASLSQDGAEKPDTIQLYSHGKPVTCRRFGNGYMLPDGTLLRWLVW